MIIVVADNSKNKLNTKVVLAVSEALAMHLVAQRFGIKISAAEDWLRHHHDTVNQSVSKDTQPQSQNFDRHLTFVKRMIKDKPGVSMGEIAEQLMADILAPKPIQHARKYQKKNPANSNGRRLADNKRPQTLDASIRHQKTSSQDH